MKYSIRISLFLAVCISTFIGQAQSSTYALVIGISDYKDDQITDLSYAHRDAEAFANYLYSKAGGSLKSDQVNLLTNEQDTFGNITVGLDWLSDVTKEGDRIILYFAGHGDVETKTVARRGFLLSYDSPSSNYRFFLNQIPEGLKFLDLACLEGMHIGNIWEDYDLDPIRQTPEFKALLKKYYPGLYE